MTRKRIDLHLFLPSERQTFNRTGGPSYKRDLEEASETKEIESRKAVLCNDDILRLIFPYLLPTAERGPSAVGRESIALAGMRKTLLNLLYTCKAFAEPALDVLWSHMDQVVPLLKILPTFKEEQGIYVSVLRKIQKALTD